MRDFDPLQERKDIQGLIVVSGLEMTGCFMGAIEDRPLTGLACMALGALVTWAMVQRPTNEEFPPTYKFF